MKYWCFWHLYSGDCTGLVYRSEAGYKEETEYWQLITLIKSKTEISLHFTHTSQLCLYLIIQANRL